MISPWKDIGDALIGWLGTQLVSLSPAPVVVEWDKSLWPHEKYPTNPLVDCPRVLLRADTETNEPLTGRGSLFLQRFSIWVYLRQTPGENHQTKLLEYLRAIQSTLLGDSNPVPVCQAGAEFLIANEVIVHDELHHQFDEPRLRVSVGEIRLEATARRFP